MGRIANIEKLVIALRDGDEDYLEQFESYRPLLIRIEEADITTFSSPIIFEYMADLIAEAMEAGL